MSINKNKSKLYAALTITLIFFANTYCLAQNNNYKSFFPLDVGNYWQYKTTSYDSFDTTFTGYEYIEVLKDTTINNYNYFKIRTFIMWDFHFNFVDSIVCYRYDSTNSNIIQYDAHENKDTLRFKFDCELNETWDDDFFTYNGLDSIRLFSKEKERVSMTQHMPAMHFQYFHYSFVRDFGPSHYIDDESWSSELFIHYNLVYAKINGVEFGTFVSVNHDEYNENLNYSLSQNYPNPFNPSTTISYSIPRSGIVQLKVYDVLGREVANLVNEEQNVGNYKVEFNASSLSSGVYFYRLQSGSFVETKKLIVLK